MKLFERVANRTFRHLLTQDFQGNDRPPGGAEAPRVFSQSNGQKLAIVSRGDAFDLYIKRVAHPELNVVLTADVAVQIAKWLLRWWVFQTWCGLKFRLWDWCLNVRISTLKPNKDA